MNYFLSRIATVLGALTFLGVNVVWAAGELAADAAAAAVAEDKDKKTTSVPKPAPAPLISGVGVAVLDTGVTLKGRVNAATLVPGSKSFVGKNPLGDAASAKYGHGTVVAQIIRAYGPSSRILSLQTSCGKNSCYGSTPAVTAGLKYAAANPSIRVVNHSNAALVNTSGAVMLQNALADQVLVMQAGNQGYSRPIGDGRRAKGLGGKAVVVGALGPDGLIWEDSNKAGDLSQHFVTAPGASQFAPNWGTSYATPRVSALAAEIRNRWPELRAEEVVYIIKASAIDMGAPGVDPIYGWGKISATRAFQPLGPLTMPTPSPSSSSSASGSGSEKTTAEDSSANKPQWETRRLRVSSATYSTVLSQPHLFKAMVFDSIGRDFEFDLVRTISEVGASATPRTVLSQWNRSLNQILLEDGPNYQLFSGNSPLTGPSSERRPELLLRSKGDGISNAQLGFGIFPQSKSGTRAWLSQNDFAETQGMAWQRIDLGRYDDEGFHSLTAFNLTDAVSVDLRYSDINDSSEADYHGAEVSAATHFSFGNSGLSLEGGLLTEEKSFLGSASGGPLSVNGAQSQFLRISGHHRLTPRVALVGALTGAISSVSEQPNTLMQNFSTMISDAWVFGLAAKSILHMGDSMSITFAQPLRVRSGTADLDMAYGLSADGEILRHEQRLDLQPSGVETLMEFAYRVPWKKKWNLGTYFSVRSQPSHIASAPSAIQLMAVAQRHF